MWKKLKYKDRKILANNVSSMFYHRFRLINRDEFETFSMIINYFNGKKNTFQYSKESDKLLYAYECTYNKYDLCNYGLKSLEDIVSEYNKDN